MTRNMASRLKRTLPRMAPVFSQGNIVYCIQK